MKSMECADIIRDLFIYLVIFKSTFHGGEEQKKQVGDGGIKSINGYRLDRSGNCRQ